MEEQITISIECDKGHIAEELRKLADAVEESNEEIKQYETYYCVAEFK